MKAKTISDFVFESTGRRPEELTGQAELRGTAEEIDSQLTARMPGDSVEDHFLYQPPNPYLYRPFGVLKSLLESGCLPSEEAALVRKAMSARVREHQS